MTRLAARTLLPLALLGALLAGGAALAAQEDELNFTGHEELKFNGQADPNTPGQDDPVPGAQDDLNFTQQDDARAAGERSLREAIERIEAQDGAYAPALPEQMLSLGLALQQQDRHVEAVDVFKRGVHLSRVNEGLYCPDQIPLVQGEVRSLIALGEYAKVEELQGYLYRVQMRSLGSGPDRAAALIQQANWQFNAYQLGLDWRGAGRLMNMWDLYRHALNDLMASESDSSPELLTPLYGMLRTQYLISEYRGEAEAPPNGLNNGFASLELNRFYGYRAENYARGQAVIKAIYDIQRINHGEDSPAAVAAIVAMADWAQWHEKTDEATALYQQALAELAAADDAKEEEVHYFAEPVPLPDMDGLRALPPAVGAEQGNILVEFGVDSRGKVTDLQRLDENEDDDSVAYRLMRQLRATQFRPRFVAGEPTETTKLVRAYDIKQ